MSTPMSFPNPMMFVPMDSIPACTPPTESSRPPAVMPMATSTATSAGSHPRASTSRLSTSPMRTDTSPREPGSPLLLQSQRPSPAPSPGWSPTHQHPSTPVITRTSMKADRTTDCSPKTFRTISLSNRTVCKIHAIVNGRKKKKKKTRVGTSRNDNDSPRKRAQNSQKTLVTKQSSVSRPPFILKGGKKQTGLETT
uniref:LP01670p n=1 Tax=Drosophila melanogaster TaxID=7227 RepID=Q8SZG9_DROME|nr:LP01670p [Drosophila melanogaster]